MASRDGNKTFAAVLMAGVAFMIAGFVADVLAHSMEPKRDALAKPVAATLVATAPVQETASAGVPSITPLLAKADVAAGQALVAQNCGACHSFNAGAPVLVGPNLYGVVGAKVAGSPGYAYSAALKKVGGTWTYARLNDWLLNPEAFAPGTLMSYAGLPSIRNRADVIAYLRTLTTTPMPLPAPTNP